MVVVTFCGHSTIYKTDDFSQWLAAILPSVIEGGAAQTLEFARKKKKVVLQYPTGRGKTMLF